MRRDADDLADAEHFPRFGGRDVALADMNAVGTCLSGKVHAVVYDQFHAVSSSGVDRQPELCKKLVIACKLVAKLHDTRSAYCKLDDLLGVRKSAEPRVGYGINAGKS